MRLSIEETNVYRNYFRFRGSNIHHPIINKFNRHKNGSKKHEDCKEKVFNCLRAKGHNVITEAWKGNVRRDIVDLTEQMIIEIEDSRKERSKRFDSNVKVIFYDK